jgi:hypothetical protein
MCGPFPCNIFNSEEATLGCWPSGRVAKKKPYLRLANNLLFLRWATKKTDTGQRNSA